MAIAAGTRLDRYEIIAPLGKGGMGEVYLALDTRLDRKIALKLLPMQFTTDADRVRRFVREAKSASALNHPNIITIYEIGQTSLEAGGIHFIATEFIEGQTLRQQIKRGRMALSNGIDVALQVASALAAAHAAGVVHRDIKPENIMLRPDGLVKVLDFGLVKLIERQEAMPDTEAPTSAGTDTNPGTIMGTAQYMSPEQARGEKVDERTDIFSLGVILYEMLAGRNPFAGSTAVEIFAAILKTDPQPLAHYLPDAPSELEHIIAKALRKDREERYQTIKDLSVDLKDLKRRLELEAKEGSHQPGARHQAAPSSERSAFETAQADAVTTGEGAAVSTVSSVKILLGEIKRHKLGVALTLAVIVMAAVAAFFYFHRQPALTDKDTILLADFENQTGEAVFDGTLKQALALHLGQSPFLNLFADDRVRETLRLMNRSPDERVTRSVGREICQRQGLKAMLTGSIASLGRNYVINLEAVNAQTSEALAREQSEVEGKEQVLRSLGEAASRLRKHLGESLSSIQQFDAPIEQATTSSLEALKAYSRGIELNIQGNFRDAIASFKHAIELDPKFALAYCGLAGNYSNTRQPGLAAEAARKAFELRERVSEREKFRIAESYYLDALGELPKAIEALELCQQTYPRDYVSRHNLALLYNSIGQFEKAAEEYGKVLRLNPGYSITLSNLSGVFTRLNRYTEAKAMGEQAIAQKFDGARLRGYLYNIAFINGDTAAMQQQVDWASARPGEYAHLTWQADAAAFAGQWQKARELQSRAADLAEQRKLQEATGEIVSLNAELAAVLGKCQQSRADLVRAAALPRTRLSLFRAGIALALCGDVAQAQALRDEAVERYPKDPVVNELYAPLVRAAINLQRGNRTQAIQMLQFRLYESVSFYYQNYLSGQAYLGEGKGVQAAGEFQTILDHRGWLAYSPLYPLAHLGLARAATLTGDTAKARQKYQDFLALWKDADADLPVLIEAKREYEKVK